MIEVNSLTKDYGGGKGIFDVSFSVGKGEVFGFLGPNGAGKTTTIRHLLGFLKPDGGGCTVGGQDCRRDAAKIQRRLGYLPGEIAFMEEMSGADFIKFMAEMRGLTDFKKTVDLLKRFELDPKSKIKRMSKGMKQKIGIVCAFMHNPEVLILDEPTAGLDPLMQSRFVELILDEKAAGKTVLMSSHIFEEVEKTCDRVGMIRAGRLVAVEEMASLKSTRVKTYEVAFESESEAQRFARENLEVTAVSRNRVTVAVREDLTPFIWAMSKYKVLGLDTTNPSLEDLFMHFYAAGREGAPR